MKIPILHYINVTNKTVAEITDLTFKVNGHVKEVGNQVYIVEVWR